MDSVLPVQTSSAAETTVTDSLQSLGKDDFLQLLVTKLQNQDPLNPMDDEDFIAQLAQFSSLEQMSNIAEAIDEANQLGYVQMQSLNNAMAAGFVGKDVKATYSGIYIEDGNSSQILYTTSNYAGEVEFTIKDEAGNVVAKLAQENVSPGLHTFTWDGKDDFGNRVAEGYYSVEAVATDASGASFTPDLSLVGTVEAVVYRDGLTYLKVQGVEIPLGDITAIGEKGAFTDED
jgi:flagellar basal-body rod modification protein FlgD